MRGFTYLEDQNWIDREMTRGDELPISLANAKKVAQWLKGNYGPKIEAICKGTPFPPHIVCAIASQETAIYWIKVTDRMTPDEILARSVYDASGDTANDPRSVFPKNTGAFRAKYGDEFTDMLIKEANETRRVMRGFGPKDWVYKGYGIFQYDLQAVTEDEAFFREKRWYDIDECLKRVIKELESKYAHCKDLWLSVKAYNGSGPRATQYMHNVQRFADVTEPAWAAASGPAVPVVVVQPPSAQPMPSAPPAVAPAAQPMPAPAPAPAVASAPATPVPPLPTPAPMPADPPPAQPAPAAQPAAAEPNPPAPQNAPQNMPMV